MKKEPLIILTGPTAVGKTELSIELAKAVNCGAEPALYADRTPPFVGISPSAPESR